MESEKEDRAELAKRMEQARQEVSEAVGEIANKTDRELEIYRMYLDRGMRSPMLNRTGTFYQLIYSLCGLVLGLVCVIGGIILFLRGITGATSWTAKILGAESKLSDAAPGVMLFIVGLFIVFVTRFKFKRWVDD